jgi:predicted metal-dependent HD superfamily phosphohydrolase
MDVSPETLERLRGDWSALAVQYGADKEVVQQAFADLVERYSGPTRFYHTLAHIAEMLDIIAGLRGGARNLAAVQLAAWFHDVVYDAHAEDNEERSAAYAEEVLTRLQLPTKTIRAVVNLVLLTKTHRAEDADADGAILLDADLTRLGAPPERFAAYSQAIKQEYAWVPEDEYRRGRRQLLRSFLRRQRLYSTDPMYRALEEQARQNLTEEIARLG